VRALLTFAIGLILFMSWSSASAQPTTVSLTVTVSKVHNPQDELPDPALFGAQGTAVFTFDAAHVDAVLDTDLGRKWGFGAQGLSFSVSIGSHAWSSTGLSAPSTSFVYQTAAYAPGPWTAWVGSLIGPVENEAFPLAGTGAQMGCTVVLGSRHQVPMFPEDVYSTGSLATRPSEFILSSLEMKYIILGNFGSQEGGWLIRCEVQSVTVSGGPTEVEGTETSWGQVKALY
jgi:hypothetical protein